METVITCEEVPANTMPQLNPSLRQKIVHLVRHGQATHNLFAATKHKEGQPCKCALNQPGCPYTNEAHTDAHLTQRGRLQASSVGAKLQQTPPPPDMAFVSPLYRTLQTATIALSRAGWASLRLVAVEDLRERNGVHVCDKRSAKEKVEGMFPTVDFGDIRGGEDTLFSETRETADALAARGKKFFLSLAERKEECFAVFSHSSFLYNTMSRAFLTPDPEVARRFTTGESRVVILTYT